MKKIKYQLNDLNCPNCAAKIEKAIKALDDVSDVSLNFVTKQLVITANDAVDANALLIHIQAIVSAIENNVTVCDMSDNQTSSHEPFKFKSYLRFIIGIATFVIALFIPSTTFMPLSLFIISYLFIGGDVVYRALKNSLKGKIFDENFLMVIATIGAFAIAEYPEAVAVMLFYQTGEFFQNMAVNHSRASIKQLMTLRPEKATLKKVTNI